MNNHRINRFPFGGMGLFLAVCVILSLTGHWYYLQERRAIRADRKYELKSIAGLKVGQLVSWRNERLADAQSFAADVVGPAVLSWRTNDPAAQAAVQNRLQRCAEIGGYQNLILAAPDGRVLLAQAGGPAQLEPETRTLVAQAAAARAPVFGDFTRCLSDTNQVCLDVAAPILNAAKLPVAVLLLRSDPGRLLYPLIQSWPMPSKSAETLLVRRDGDDVLFLNRLRHNPAPPLSLRIPISRTNVPAVEGVLGRIGVFSGIDYRGVPVESDIRPVPGSSWFMVAKVDADEILSEASYRGHVILAFVIFGILLCSAMLAILFYVGQMDLFRELIRHTQDDRFAGAPVSETMVRRAGKLAVLMAGFVLAFGGLGLMGWVLDIEELKSVLPGHVAMKANVAVGLIFTSLALGSLAWSVRRGRRAWRAWAYASVPLLIGLGTFAEQLLGLDFGIDQLLFHAPAGMAGALAPGRMSPLTALNFILAGCALLLASVRRTGRLAQWVSLLVMLLAWLPLLAYLYGAPNLQGLGHYAQTSGHTALAFLFLGTGVLCLRPAEGVMQSLTIDNLGGWLLRRLLLFVLLLPLAIGWLRVIGEQQGLFEGSFGVALTMTLMTVVALVLVWWSARSLGRIDHLRRQNEKQVYEGHETLRATLYGIGDGVIATDAAGAVTQMNPVAEQLTGWPEAEAQGKPLREIFRLVNETTRDEVDNPFATVVRTGRIAGLANHTILLSRDGKEFSIADSGAPILDKRGALIGVVLVFRDQTAARAAEAALQAETKKLDTIFECAPIAMLVINEKTNIVWANSAVAALVGDKGSRSSPLGQQPGRALRCVHESKDPRGCGYSSECAICPLRRGLSAVLAGGASLYGEELTVELVRSGLSCQVWLRVGLEPLLLDGRKHVIVALEDITNHKRMEKEARDARAETNRLLELSEQARRALLSAAEDNNAILQALQESTTLLQESQKVARLGSYVLDIPGGTWRNSDELDRLFGIGPAYKRTVEGWLDIVHPDDRGMMADYFQNEVLRQGKMFDKEYRVVRRDDGAEFWVHGIGRLDFDSAGRPIRMYGTIQDITGHKRMEVWREMSGEILQKLSEPADLKNAIGLVLATLKTRTGFDAAGIRLESAEDFPYFAQEGFSTEFLLTENTLLERGADGGVCRDDNGHVRLECTCGLVLAGKTDPASPFFTRAGSFWTNDSAPLLELPPAQDPRLHPRNQCIHQGYASVALIPIWGEERIVGLIHLNDRRKDRFTLEMIEILEGIASHIGAALLRKQAEEQLRKSELRFRELALLLPTGVFELDSAGRVLYANQALQQWFGYSEADLKHGIDGLQIIVEPEREVARSRLRQLLVSDEVLSQEYTVRRKNGTEFPALITARAMLRDGRPAGISGIVVDLSEHKHYDEMRIAKERADAANRAKSSFLAHMSHEIRTPLNAILGFAQLLLRDPAVTPRQRQQIETINRSGEHLLELINDVLEMSKIEAGRMVLRPVAFDCHDMLVGLTKMFQLRTEARQLTFEVARAPGLPQFVKADGGKLREVLINLLENAFKFTQHGKVSLRVDFAQDSAGSRLLFQVHDTGPGITPQDQARLFRYFEQTQAGHAVASGTGLGLAISRHLVQLMGGKITVASEVGKGSSFRFDVRVEVVDRAAAQTTSAAWRVVGLQPEQPPIRTLVVDDLEDSREFLVQLLAPAGFEVRQAANGRGALLEFDAWRPQLILLDLRMPEMDGIEVVRQIRLRPEGRDVRIIVVTAGIEKDSQQEAIDAGADAFFMKPLYETELFQKIGELLGVAYVWTGKAATPVVDAQVAPEELAKLSRELRRGIRVAAIRGDFDRVLEEIARAEERSPAVAQTLRVLAGRYDTAGILELLDKSSKERPHEE